MKRNAGAREEVLNEETTSDRNVMRTSTEDVVKRLIDIIDRNYGSGGATHAQSDVITAADSTTMPMMTEREEELMIDEVERRIIENLEDTTLCVLSCFVYIHFHRNKTLSYP